MEDIPNKIQTQPGIICDVNLKNENGKEYIVIDVKPYEVPISYQGKYHYRSGSTKQELKGNALNNFLLKKTGKTWDDVIEPRASFNDIDLEAIEAFKDGAYKSKRMMFIKDEEDIERIIDNLLLLEDNQLKRSDVLLFGKNAGLPELLIEYSSGGISVTLFKNIYNMNKLVEIGFVIAK